MYEAGAMMLEDESIVIAGLLVGLNVIDCNMAIKDEDLDQPVSTSSLFFEVKLLPAYCGFIFIVKTKGRTGKFSGNFR